MRNRFHEPWASENFYFHRTDPTPWVEIEEPVKATTRVKEFVKTALIIMAIVFIIGFVVPMNTV